jgi:hypothetical protein
VTHFRPGAHWALWIAIGLAWMLVGVPTAMAVDPLPTPVPGPVVTTTLVAASPNPVTYGSSVTLTATVTPNPGGGTITWPDTLNVGSPKVDELRRRLLEINPEADVDARQMAYDERCGVLRNSQKQFLNRFCYRTRLIW